MSAKNPEVYISSTKEDLVEYRELAIHVCHRLGLFPIAMEEFPPDPRGAVDYCKAKVEEADAFIGIYAHRYGWQPFGAESIIEMEYQWAVERGIPIYAFIGDDTTPWRPIWIDVGDPAERLKKFKERLKRHNVRFFTNSLEDFREDMFLTASKIRDAHKPESGADIHYVSDIPQPPKEYIAHPYTLMKSSPLLGRREELNLLTEWVTKPSSAVYQARIMNVVAIGGMGKSALTWHWFNEIAPNAMKPLDGRMWWSFYEEDADFENFIIRALAYVTGRSSEDVKRNTHLTEREDILFNILNQHSYLLVLDGLERILNAYARIDASYMTDDDLDARTYNFVPEAFGTHQSIDDNKLAGQHRLRKTIDPRAGKFLRKLRTLKSSRILITTRLYPADLQDMFTGEPIEGSYGLFLTGLSDGDALELWRQLGGKGSHKLIISTLNSFDNYPLLIRALAGEVARFRRAPGDFDRWLQNNPDFEPLKLSGTQAKSHVLYFALQGLDEATSQVLSTLAAFRMPVDFETLLGILVGTGKPFSTESALTNVLTELEDRGLLGWDTVTNRYDLHPIVRGVAREGIADETKQDVYQRLYDHFETTKTVEEGQIEDLESLSPIIEQYNALVGLRRYDEAHNLFYSRISKVMRYGIQTHRQYIELLEMLFPDGPSQLPRLTKAIDRDWTLEALKLAYMSDKQSIMPSLLDPLSIERKTVFVSYSRDDWDLYVEPLVKHLGEKGFTVWVDQHLLQGGDDWLDEINKALDLSDYMILCVSSTAINSKYVKMEYRYFMRHNKVIVPVICREDNVKLPAELGGIQYLKYDLNIVTDRLRRMI